MLFKAICFLVILSSSALGAQQESARFLSTNHEGKTTSFLTGSLGVVNPDKLTFLNDRPNSVKNAATATLLDILNEFKAYTGDEVILPTDHNIGVDVNGDLHIRFQQYLNSYPIEGAAIMMHFNGTNGSVFAVNGEFHPNADSIDDDYDGTIGQVNTNLLDCESAMEIALAEYSTVNGTDPGINHDQSKWESECQEAAVQGRDGKAHVAYKRLRGYQPERGGPYQRDLIFASPATGALLAVHPKVYSALSLATYDCMNGDGSYCVFVSNSTSQIHTGDPVANDAHNYLIDVYNFYKTVFNRDSLDDAGMHLDSFVHFEVDYNNAFYYSGQMVYGDGDEILFAYFSKGFDVVAHELSHGVTDYTSQLVYLDESGALNEAFSDIMAASAERLVLGKNITAVWLLGEDIDIYPYDGVGLRNMEDPPSFGHPDHYGDRYKYYWDYGGVHVSCNIVSKMFSLMVQGGVHWKTNIAVPALDPNFDVSIKAAAKIFYDANTMCLTPASDFVSARECTLMHALSAQKPIVSQAWDAVGVRAVLPITNRVEIAHLSLPFDNDVQLFLMTQTVPAGRSVTCELSGTNGDPDLYVNFGSPPDLMPIYEFSDCASVWGGLYEECTTGIALYDTEVYIAVEVWEASTDMSLLCRINGVYPPLPTTIRPRTITTRPSTIRPTTTKSTPRPCKNRGAQCSNSSQCCGSPSIICDGNLPNRKFCKLCKKTNKKCTKNLQCCSGLKCKRGSCVKKT